MAVTGSLSYGGFEIKVSPDRLLEAARDVLNKTNTMNQSFNSIKSAMQKTRGYWRGEAGDHHRKLYSDQQSDINEIIRNLKERVSELEQIAANYSSGESKAASTAQQLATNVIEI